MEFPTKEFASFFNTVLENFLCMLPLRSGQRLVDVFRQYDETRNRAVWFERVLGRQPDELMRDVLEHADREDTVVRMNVFLWKQKNGVIDKTLRIRCSLGARARPLTYYLHRCMMGNGYTGIVDGQDPYTRVGVHYLEEIELLLSRWQTPEFGRDGEGFWDLVILLNVLGPQLASYHRRGEVLGFAEYILREYKRDNRLSCFNDDSELAALMLLASDLGILSGSTLPIFEDLFLSRTKRSVLCYPALIVASVAYGQHLDGFLKNVEIQGGTALFRDLALTPQ